MDGIAKEWFDAYKLHQVVGDWYEFMDDVEENFDHGDFSLMEGSHVELCSPSSS
jgi:hypothetical protein